MPFKYRAGRIRPKSWIAEWSPMPNTVNPGYNEPPYNEFLAITNWTPCLIYPPIQIFVKLPYNKIRSDPLDFADFYMGIRYNK